MDYFLKTSFISTVLIKVISKFVNLRQLFCLCFLLFLLSQILRVVLKFENRTQTLDIFIPHITMFFSMKLVTFPH